MKARIENDRIINFEPDGYDAGNPEVIVKEIKGFDVAVNMEDVAANKTRECGVFLYVLNEEGIVQKLILEEQPEYIEYQKKQREAEYRAKTDAIFFKYQRGEATEQEWKDAVQAVKSRFPY